MVFTVNEAKIENKSLKGKDLVVKILNAISKKKSLQKSTTDPPKNWYLRAASEELIRLQIALPKVNLLYQLTSLQ